MSAACKARRGERSTVQCELPAEHSDRWHYGRSRTGRWFSWPVAAGPSVSGVPGGTE